MQSLKLGSVTMLGGAESIEDTRQHIRDRIAEAVAAGGARALENPHSSTIFHEAGHTVVHTHFGHCVRYCKIWKCKRGSERGQWTGMTMTDRKWRTDETTSPEDDFRQACCLMAGVLAEILFDHDNFRQASSLDEIICADVLAVNIAIKTGRDGRDGRDVKQQVIAATTDILKSNADVVHDIAKKLKRHATLRGVRLSTLLGRVSTSPSQFELKPIAWRVK